MDRFFLIAASVVSMLVAGYLAEPPRDANSHTLASTNSLAPALSSAVGTPMMMSPHSNPIAVYQGMVFVANTPANTLDVFESNTRTLIDRIPVGIQPVGVAVRPDGKEIWVANHVSDSVNVIDNDPSNGTFHAVVATIQEFDPTSRSTRFDEPVAIAFASNEKAYVSLPLRDHPSSLQAQEKPRVTLEAKVDRLVLEAPAATVEKLVLVEKVPRVRKVARMP